MLCIYPTHLSNLFSFFFFITIRRPPRSTLSLHDALPISHSRYPNGLTSHVAPRQSSALKGPNLVAYVGIKTRFRSEEHTSELQSRRDLVCRLLLEKKKKKKIKKKLRIT